MSIYCQLLIDLRSRIEYDCKVENAELKMRRSAEIARLLDKHLSLHILQKFKKIASLNIAEQ
jgi:hypothetical protein